MNYKYIFGFVTLFGLTLSLAAIPSFKTINFIYAQPAAETKSPNIMMFIGDDLPEIP